VQVLLSTFPSVTKFVCEILLVHGHVTVCGRVPAPVTAVIGTSLDSLRNEPSGPATIIPRSSHERERIVTSLQAVNTLNRPLSTRSSRKRDRDARNRNILSIASIYSWFYTRTTLVREIAIDVARRSSQTFSLSDVLA
jgi:hypothetical protein